jgi:1,2-dihydroxy-3-keto-5-methylthiopentene dioxygenase
VTVLAIYDETGSRLEAPMRHGDRIAERLAKIGVRFERGDALSSVPTDAGEEDVLAAYADVVERLNAQYGFR